MVELVHQETMTVEQSLPRRITAQRWTLNERRQELTSLTRLRADLGRQLAQLDRASGAASDDRRSHLQDSIRLLEGQIEEARAQVESAQRVLRRLEQSAAPEAPRRRRRRRSRSH
jgi:chromosome segregation ATPase